MDDLAAYCDFVRTTPLKLGIEMDYVPGREDRIASLLDAHEFDYVVGSVHFLGDGAVDDPDFDVWGRDGDPDGLWRRYFEMIAETARTGLYDILAHPDLVKYWGHDRPRPRARRPLSLRARDRGDRRDRRRRRGLHGGLAQAG